MKLFFCCGLAAALRLPTPPRGVRFDRRQAVSQLAGGLAALAVGQHTALAIGPKEKPKEAPAEPTTLQEQWDAETKVAPSSPTKAVDAKPAAAPAPTRAELAKRKEAEARKSKPIKGPAKPKAAASRAKPAPRPAAKRAVVKARPRPRAAPPRAQAPKRRATKPKPRARPVAKRAAPTRAQVAMAKAKREGKSGKPPRGKRGKPVRR